MKVRFYVTASGRSPVEEFLSEQSDALRADFFDAIAMLSSGQRLGMPLSRSLSSVHAGLSELRLRDRSGQVRVFYFIKKGEAIYLLHAFRKKTRTLPKRELAVALRRIKEV